MIDDRIEIGLKKSESITIEQILLLFDYPSDFDFHGLSAGDKCKLIADWIEKVCGMNELPDVERVAYGEFLYREQRRLYPAWRQEEKVLEVKRALPLVKPLVRKAAKAYKLGDIDTALQHYQEAFNLMPLLPGIGLKAAKFARSQYKLRTAQHIANTVASKSYEKPHWNFKATSVAIEATIRLFAPWLNYGLAPKQIVWIGGEGATRNLFELVKNPYMPPLKQLSSKQQQFVDRLGTELRLFFSFNLSSLCGEDDLDFPVITSPSIVTSLHEGFDLVRDTIAPRPNDKGGRRTEVNIEYKEALQEYLHSNECEYVEKHYRFTSTEPIWYWPSKFMTIYATKPEPWMLEHNAMLKRIEDSYSDELVAKREQIRANEIYRWKAMFSHE